MLVVGSLIVEELKIPHNLWKHVQLPTPKDKK